jgi:hypothetical protein
VVSLSPINGGTAHSLDAFQFRGLRIPERCPYTRRLASRPLSGRLGGKTTWSCPVAASGFSAACLRWVLGGGMTFALKQRLNMPCLCLLFKISK